MIEPFVVWKSDTSEPLSNEDLFEISIFDNTYERINMWPDNGTEFELRSGRKVTFERIHYVSGDEAQGVPSTG